MKIIRLNVIFFLLAGFVLLGASCDTSDSIHTLRVQGSPENALGNVDPFPLPMNVTGTSATNWNGDYTVGTSVQLTGKGVLGWIFDHWEGDLSGTSNPMTIIMDEDKSVTAVLTDDIGTIVGTWVNVAYDGQSCCWAKLDWESDGNFNAFWNSYDSVASSIFLGKYWLKWTEGSAVFYKVETTDLNNLWYNLIKISNSGNTMEIMHSLSNVLEFPSTIDPLDPQYRTYTRQ